MTFPIRTCEELGNDYVVVIDRWNFREQGLALCYNNDKREHFLIALKELKDRDNTVYTG
jgi:hypothetical protein